MFKDVHCKLFVRTKKKEQKQFKYGTCSTCTDIENCLQYIKLKSKLQKSTKWQKQAVKNT